ncbi:unnamed protein product [Macrosiphum euphorbiae]|uniref:Uncharacterized protein n=1 Tax=Macrosiphum euphorbiae TaxID=13131 RepID=A0AAV0W8Q9_9HEMI|nr:unnamed protein product [Macrosiphum euphorbiae]
MSFYIQTPAVGDKGRQCDQPKVADRLKVNGSLLGWSSEAQGRRFWRRQDHKTGHLGKSVVTSSGRANGTVAAGGPSMAGMESAGRRPANGSGRRMQLPRRREFMAKRVERRRSRYASRFTRSANSVSHSNTVSKRRERVRPHDRRIT